MQPNSVYRADGYLAPPPATPGYLCFLELVEQSQKLLQQSMMLSQGDDWRVRRPWTADLHPISGGKVFLIEKPADCKSFSIRYQYESAKRGCIITTSKHHLEFSAYGHGASAILTRNQGPIGLQETSFHTCTADQGRFAMLVELKTWLH